MQNDLTSVFKKPRVLIVEDDDINAEILKISLDNHFDLIRANNGQEALDFIDKDQDIQLILLDILMPVLDGFGVLEGLKERHLLGIIPVIVLTGEKSYEVRCLKMGADDFIRKPFDIPEAILARAERVIESYENRHLISSISTEPISNLFNGNIFPVYVKKYIRPKDNSMDMLFINIDGFSILNEIYDRKTADSILGAIGQGIREFFMKNNTLAIASRDHADHFYVFAPHLDTYDDLLNEINVEISKVVPGHVVLRIGVYNSVEEDEDVELMKSRAKSAGDTLRGKHESGIALYDNDLHDKQIYNQRLVDDFNKAIANEEFIVYLQPKYCIKGDKNVLAAGEALIRWIHPKLGFISPGAFIPLFEENGLIRLLDRYIWDKTAEYIKNIRDLLGYYIPISVNVSRIDLLEPDIVEKLTEIVKKHDIDISAFHLEVTESAYTNGNKYLGVIRKLQEVGFVMEMDDFGTGYSSLNMLTEIPFDYLKIDMGFTRKLGQSNKNDKIVEYVIDISNSLGAKTIAEGAETEEQVNILKKLGCDYVQGYYFSKPLPYNDFIDRVKKELL